ncbi:3-hydroxyacyl-CoA dehydrogenase [Streptomyces rubiginosohelvolus]|uniref:3-hydroxyacyl-CoA dehydrogenase n=1 Tax=Streptomyces rubiginosohelvolus TaxID=67362 RepID=UPI0036A3A3C7
MTGIARVAVIGTGVLGSQIMMQAAYHGKKVIGYGISDELLAQLPQRWEWMRGFYADDLPDFDAGRFDEAIAAIEATTDIGVAVKDVDLVIEAVPENLELKREVWSEIGRLAPEETLFATNTSALLPSDFAEATGRTDRFLALHFANMIWRYNTGEVMRTPMTSQQTFDTVLAFAAEIGLEPIAIEKETPGYVLNGLLDPWLDGGSILYVDGVASPFDIDRTWRTAMGSPYGPFEVFDTVGFNVASIFAAQSDNEKLQKFARILAERGTDRGRDGRSSGEGFYRYDSRGENIGPADGWEIEG